MNVFENTPAAGPVDDLPDAVPHLPDAVPAGTPLRELAAEAPAAADKPVLGRRARVTLLAADGVTEEEPFVVRIDNRDYLRWDKTAPRQGWVKKDQAIPPFLMATFLAWSSATRAGLTTLKWNEFESRALEIDNIDEDPAEDGAFPTN